MHTADKFSTPAMGYNLMPDGQIEIQVLWHAVKEMSIASLRLKSAIDNLHSYSSTRLPPDCEEHLRFNIDHFCRIASQISDQMFLLMMMREDGLAAIQRDRLVAKGDKDEAAVLLRAATTRMAETEAKERALMADAEALETHKKKFKEMTNGAVNIIRRRDMIVAGRYRRIINLEEEKVLEKLLNAVAGDTAEPATKEATREGGSTTGPSETLDIAAKGELDADGQPGTVQSTEKQAIRDMKPFQYAPKAAVIELEKSPNPGDVLTTAVEDVPGSQRVRIVIESDEDQALRELNSGADAAIEDAAEAAAAVARMKGRCTSRLIQSRAAAGTSESGLDTEKTSNTSPVKEEERYRLQNEVLTAREERLWDRDIIVSSLEMILDARTAAILDCERRFEAMKHCHLELLRKEKELVNDWFDYLSVEARSLKKTTELLIN